MAFEAQRGVAQWSKDFVEHLRTVHFSLVILSLGLIIVASSQPNSVTRRARVQLDQITTVAEKLKSGWLNARCSEQRSRLRNMMTEANVKEKEINAFYLTFVRPIRQGNFPEYEFVIENNCLMVDSVPAEPQMALYPMVPVGKQFTKVTPPLVDAPKTLAEFVALWNEMNQHPQVILPTVLGDKILIMDGSHQPGVEFTLAKQSALSSPPGRMEFYLMPQGEEWHDTSHIAIFGYRFAADGVIPIIDFKNTDLDGLSYLREQLDSDESRLTWRGGSFAETFGDLYEIAKGREAASFKVWRGALSAELDRSGDSFEWVGLKLPAQATTLWGVVLLIGVQFYFLIHLMELSRKMTNTDAGWEVAWVGVYQGKLARLLFRSSALLLPVGAVVVLGIKAVLIGESPWRWLHPIVAIPISIALCTQTATHLPKAVPVSHV
jgi:hypothetical protein